MLSFVSETWAEDGKWFLATSYHDQDNDKISSLHASCFWISNDSVWNDYLYVNELTRTAEFCDLKLQVSSQSALLVN